MKKAIAFIALFALLMLTFCSCTDTGDQGDGNATPGNTTLGDYDVVIESCRLSTDYEGSPIVIVKFKFTNNGDEPACFAWSLDYHVYQNGVGLNECYFANDAANYSSDNQTKEIKKGASLYVEVAYKLNDRTTDVEVEVAELFSYSENKLTKRFSIV